MQNRQLKKCHFCVFGMVGNGGKWWENGGNFTKTYETNFWGVALWNT